MKTILKVFIGCFLFFIIAGVSCGVLIGGVADKVDKTEVKTNDGKTKKIEKTETLTKENYDKITQGDALSGEGGTPKEEVIKILGKPDSSSESKVGDYSAEYLAWTSVKNGVSITVTITNDKVSSKSYSKL